jgi:hypothetical protein
LKTGDIDAPVTHHFLSYRGLVTNPEPLARPFSAA